MLDNFLIAYEDYFLFYLKHLDIFAWIYCITDPVSIDIKIYQSKSHRDDDSWFTGGYTRTLKFRFTIYDRFLFLKFGWLPYIKKSNP